MTWAACCWLLSILLLSFVKAEKQIRCVFNWFFTLFSFLFLLILLTFSIPESRYVIPVQVLQIDYNRALEGPPGSKNLLSSSLREYLSRVSELCQCYFGQYYKINKISFIEVLISTVQNLTSNKLKFSSSGFICSDCCCKQNVWYWTRQYTG